LRSSNETDSSSSGIDDLISPSSVVDPAEEVTQHRVTRRSLVRLSCQEGLDLRDIPSDGGGPSARGGIRDAGNMCAVLADQHPLYSEYLVPCVERLGLSILRMAALIAAAERQHTVKMRHAVKAGQLAEAGCQEGLDLRDILADVGVRSTGDERFEGLQVNLC